jgi:hypothetical protein
VLELKNVPVKKKERRRDMMKIMVVQNSHSIQYY